MKEIFERTSVRHFTDEKVERNLIKKLLEAAMQAPSAGNQQPWEFLIIEDPAMLAKMSRVSKYAGPLAGAPLGIIVLLDDRDLKYKECWQQDLSAATENILLEAVHLGLGAVWLAIADFPERIKYAAEVLNLPEYITAFAAIAIGHPAKQRAATSRYDEAKVHYGAYKK